MFSTPPPAEPLISTFSIAFTRPTFQRARVLWVGAILAMGRRTVANVLWTVRSIAQGHFSSYHRVFSRASWRLWPLGQVLVSAVLQWIPHDQPVLVAGDDTAAQRRGAKVYGKAKHRDAVRSSHSLTVWKWGHKWVVLAIVVRFAFTTRNWALPVLCVLYRSKEQNQAAGRRHKTPAQLARQLMAVLIHWFPSRKLMFLGDGGYGSHELACFFVRHRRHAALISRFHPEANLYAPPPRRRAGTGRPRIKGQKRPPPRQTVTRRQRGRRVTVRWYGGATRRVALISDTRRCTRRARAWCRCAGCTCTTATVRIATIGYSAPIRHYPRRGSSAFSRVAGPSRRLFKKYAPTWASRPRGSASPSRCCAPLRPRWACPVSCV